MASMMLARLNSSETTNVLSSARAVITAWFADQHDEYVTAAFVPTNSAGAPSSSTCGAIVPSTKRTDAVPAP